MTDAVQWTMNGLATRNYIGAALKRSFNWVALILGVSALCFGRTPAVTEFFRDQMHLSQRQIAEIQNGKAVAKTLPTTHPSDIFVFGAVFIHAEPVAWDLFVSR